MARVNKIMVLLYNLLGPVTDEQYDGESLL